MWRYNVPFIVYLAAFTTGVLAVEGVKAALHARPPQQEIHASAIEENAKPTVKDTSITPISTADALSITMPEGIIGAIKTSHKVDVMVGGRTYSSLTPFYLKRCKVGNYYTVNPDDNLSFEAKRQPDDKAVRVYVFPMSGMVIEEMLDKSEEIINGKKN